VNDGAEKFVKVEDIVRLTVSAVIINNSGVCLCVLMRACMQST
jgi:hypothetical protein